MTERKDTSIKIRRISIKNYKGIDELEMKFPTPRMVGDPDILIMGSRNGLGKTSIIECCSLLLLAITNRKDSFRLRDRYSTVDVPDLLIKAGSEFSEITGNIVLGTKPTTIRLKIDRQGIVKICAKPSLNKIWENEPSDLEKGKDDFIKAICGFTSNPVIENTFLFFHSYRKVQEGNPELGMMVERDQIRRKQSFGMHYELPISAFKLRILRSLMEKANLFEFDEDKNSDDTIEKLNELVKSFAGGTINKLRPSPDNTVDFRVNPINGHDSFTFDGLSSGQKEIISTLFLIWYHTKDNPSVVFIDEPELHLNAQWHRSFVKKLVSLAPQNQYILATHSEDIMDSVNEDCRVLLLNEQEERE
jgi:predicted ATP-dependent endonuclease of OLD family